MIEASGLTKRYGATLAVDGLSFGLRPGMVTGFLGPNGSGKSTTMRLIMGLDYPDAGTVTVGRQPYRRLRWPLSEVGARLLADTTVTELAARAGGSLEDAFFGLAGESAEFRAGEPPESPEFRAGAPGEWPSRGRS
jgi:energy-coupling factor transporter ATP-binding protein EcfA2